MTKRVFNKFNVNSENGLEIHLSVVIILHFTLHRDSSNVACSGNAVGGNVHVLVCIYVCVYYSENLTTAIVVYSLA